jgi:hypothetical protein
VNTAQGDDCRIFSIETPRDFPLHNAAPSASNGNAAVSASNGIAELSCADSVNLDAAESDGSSLQSGNSSARFSSSGRCLVVCHVH